MGKMKVSVTGLRGNTDQFQLPDDATYQDFEKKYCIKTGQDPEEIKFVYCTETLDNTNKQKKLSEYSISNGATILCITRLRGGSDTITLKIKCMNSQSGTTTSQSFTVNKKEIIYDVKKKVYTKYKQLPPDYFILRYNRQQLECDRTVLSYGIPNQAELDTIEGQRGEVGSKTLLLTISYDAQSDVFALEEGFCVKMPCGHFVGKEGITAYLLSLLQNKCTKFNCPGFMDKEKKIRCDKEWDPQFCMKASFLNSQQKRKIEEMLAKNYANKVMKILECKTCKTICYLQSTIKEFNVYCPICAKETKRKDFCRRCLKDWEFGHQKKCLDQTNHLLATCGMKSVIGMLAPEYRACPNCKSLIEHKSGCKHMTCNECHLKFCYICLRLKGNYTWSCGSYNSHCPLQKRQVLSIQDFVS